MSILSIKSTSFCNIRRHRRWGAVTKEECPGIKSAFYPRKIVTQAAHHLPFLPEVAVDLLLVEPAVLLTQGTCYCDVLLPCRPGEVYFVSGYYGSKTSRQETKEASWGVFCP